MTKQAVHELLRLTLRRSTAIYSYLQHQHRWRWSYEQIWDRIQWMAIVASIFNIHIFSISSLKLSKCTGRVENESAEPCRNM